MHNQRKKGEENPKRGKSNKYGTRDWEVFRWKNNLKQNSNYNSCQKRNKRNEIELCTQP
jgi:hypothetical protein